MEMKMKEPFGVDHRCMMIANAAALVGRGEPDTRTERLSQ